MWTNLLSQLNPIPVFVQFKKSGHQFKLKPRCFVLAFYSIYSITLVTVLVDTSHKNKGTKVNATPWESKQNDHSSPMPMNVKCWIVMVTCLWDNNLMKMLGQMVVKSNGELIKIQWQHPKCRDEINICGIIWLDCTRSMSKFEAIIWSRFQIVVLPTPFFICCRRVEGRKGGKMGLSVELYFCKNNVVLAWFG